MTLGRLSMSLPMQACPKVSKMYLIVHLWEFLATCSCQQEDAAETVAAEHSLSCSFTGYALVIGICMHAVIYANAWTLAAN